MGGTGPSPPGSPFFLAREARIGSTGTMTGPDFSHERALIAEGHLRIAGVDEVGRGPLAGPVTAAAVILNPGDIPNGVNDSKKLTSAARRVLADRISASAEMSIAHASVAEIDTLNILRATHQAMLRALNQLTPNPDHVLVDGLPVPVIQLPQTAIVRGDSLSYSIAAASIIAKVTRDRLMLDYDTRYPGYGFAKHKGYGTASHLKAIQHLGPCPIHRRSFAPLKPPSQQELF